MLRYVTSTYPSISLIADPSTAQDLSQKLPSKVLCAATHHDDTQNAAASDLIRELPNIHTKADLIATFGGDGTILRASSLFSTSDTAPPILAFAMGTLGFLGEWKFRDYKQAFRQVYMSGATHERLAGSAFDQKMEATTARGEDGWKQSRAQALGESRTARVLFRRRLKVELKAPGGAVSSWSEKQEHHAMNEVLLYRGANPHLIHIQIHINGRFLTEAVADGMIVSTPTGSTAYSLSSGGSIIHPLVPALLLTPICPRSLSFRPLVLPASSEITLTLSEKNRNKEAEWSIDGLRRPDGVGIGYQIRVTGEQPRSNHTKGSDKDATPEICGVPFVMRASVDENDDGWVGGLTNLLKFNYPFAEED